MPEKKNKTTKKAATKPKAEPKPRSAKPPKESREGWGTFALRLPVAERDAIHKMAGPAGASRFARTVLVAFANEDEGAFNTAVKEAREQRQ